MTSAQAAATVVVVGSVNMDLVAHAARLPAPGETLIGQAFAGTPGGKGGNQAVAASRLGAEVALIGRVGMRQHGQDLLGALEAERVHTQAVRRLSQRPQAVDDGDVDEMAGQHGQNVHASGNAHAQHPADERPVGVPNPRR